MGAAASRDVAELQLAAGAERPAKGEAEEPHSQQRRDSDGEDIEAGRAERWSTSSSADASGPRATAPARGDVAVVDGGGGCVVCSSSPPHEACDNANCSPASHPLCRECAARLITSVPAGKGRCPAPGCGAPLSAFSVVHRATGRALRVADLSSPLAGSVFVRAGLEGFGSLHFSRERCFMRFDRARFPWLKRDFDASPLLRDEFEIERWTFDDREREFCGSLCAAFTAGSPWDACELRVHFDEGYEQVLDGWRELSCAARPGAVQRQRLGSAAEETLFRRLRSVPYPAVYVQDAAALSPWVLDLALRALAYMRELLSGQPAWVTLRLWKQALPVEPSAPSFLFAPRAGAGRSCVSLNSPELGLGEAPVVFERESFDVTSRTFEGAGSVNGVALTVRLLFDAELETIEGGELKVVSDVLHGQPLDVISQKYATAIPVRYRMLEIAQGRFGKLADHPSAAALRFTVVSPWQFVRLCA
jgi:hypothetical protein